MANLLPTKRFQLAFTLIELLIVVAIIAIVVTVGVAAYSTAQRNSRDSQRAADLQKLAGALEQYYADHGEYPQTNFGNFETANRYGDSDDAFSCLVGGSNAVTINTWHTTAGFPAPCLQPFNTYIADGDFTKIPRDAKDTWYLYASDGQSYALTTMSYEGNPPADHLFICANIPFYYNKGSGYAAMQKDGKQYFIQSPQDPPSATCS